MRTLATKIAKFMMEKVAEEVKNYQSDLIRDVELLSDKRNNLPIYWGTRESGTNMVSFNDWESYTNEERIKYLNFSIAVVQYYQREAKNKKWYKLKNIYDDAKAEVEEMDEAAVIDELTEIKEQF